MGTSVRSIGKEDLLTARRVHGKAFWGWGEMNGVDSVTAKVPRLSDGVIQGVEFRISERVSK